MTRGAAWKKAANRYSAQTQKLYRHKLSESGRRSKGHALWEPELLPFRCPSKALKWASALGRGQPTGYQLPALCFLSTESVAPEQHPGCKEYLGGWLPAEPQCGQGGQCYEAPRLTSEWQLPGALQIHRQVSGPTEEHCQAGTAQQAELRSGAGSATPSLRHSGRAALSLRASAIRL